MITDDDRNMILYFIRERGDIESWSKWRERKVDIELEYPELIEALKQQTIAHRTLRAIVESIEADIDV